MTLEDQVRRYAREARAILLSQASQQPSSGIAEWIGYDANGRGLVKQNGKTRQVNVIGNISLKRGQLVLLDANDTIQIMDLPPREQPRRAERRQGPLVIPPFKKQRSIILSTLLPADAEEDGGPPVIDGDYIILFIDFYDSFVQTFYQFLGVGPAGQSMSYRELTYRRGPVIQFGVFNEDPGSVGNIFANSVEYKTRIQHEYYSVNVLLPRNPDPVNGAIAGVLPSGGGARFHKASTKDKTYYSYCYSTGSAPRVNTIFQNNGDTIYNTFAAIGTVELHGVYVIIDNQTGAVTTRDELLKEIPNRPGFYYNVWLLSEEDLYFDNMDNENPLKIAYDRGANKTFLNGNPYAYACYNPDTGKAVLLKYAGGSEWRIWTKFITPGLDLLLGLAFARTGDTNDGTWTLEHSFSPAGFTGIDLDRPDGSNINFDVMVAAF